MLGVPLVPWVRRRRKFRGLPEFSEGNQSWKWSTRLPRPGLVTQEWLGKPTCSVHSGGSTTNYQDFWDTYEKNNMSGCRFSMDSKNDGVATDSEDIKRWRFVRIQDRLFSNCLVRVNFHPRLDPTCFFRNIQLPQSTKTCDVPSTRHNLFGPRKA